MLITDTGTLIRIAVSEISLLKGSGATGVRLMRLAEDATLVSFAVAEKVEEEEEAQAEESSVEDATEGAPAATEE